MYVLTAIVSLLALATRTNGLKCFTCSAYTFDGEANADRACFSLNGNSTFRACSSAGSDVTTYCRTRFTMQDGIISSLERGCVYSDAYPGATTGTDVCETVLSATYNPTDRTNCNYYCTGDNCNIETFASLKSCETDCGRPSGYGACNYISGQCVCDPGRTGQNCEVPGEIASSPARKCVQCDSETKSDCVSSTTAVDCPTGQRYCSSARTTIYNESDAVRTVLTRGCTDRFVAVDECAFTDIYHDTGLRGSGYNEFTCYSTCDTDGCNTNTPNGVLDGTEKANLYCVVCSGTSGCVRSTTRQACPSSSTHCKATASYAISNRVDQHNAKPAYKLISVVRECANSSVETKCTESSVGDLSFKNVVCQESCREDGCNTGWPARPRCLSCTSVPSDIADGSDRCLENPNPAQMCDYPYQSYCYIQDSGIEEGKTSAEDLSPLIDD